MTALMTWWREDLLALSPDADPQIVLDVGADLLARWTQEHRRYHTTQHLAEVLCAADDLAAGLTLEQQLTARLAAWLHDAVYAVDAPPGDNERRSADLARTLLPTLGLSASVVGSVADLVTMTIDHAPAALDPVADCFHDADLWILSSGRDRFDEYCRQVREEFAHVPDVAYARGRTAILAPLLHRPALYRTARARDRWTASARDNLRRELDRLAA